MPTTKKSAVAGWGTMLGLVLLMLPGPAPALEPGDLQALRARALELVNEDRRAGGLSPLAPEDALQQAAQAHAEDMIRRSYYDHVSPEGESVMDRHRAAGGDARGVVAENIARCDGCDPPPNRAEVERLHRGWMNSPGHRRNILDPGMARFGFGIAAEAGTLRAVQTFAGPGLPRSVGAGEAQAKPIEPAAQAGLLVELVNEARREAGVPPLQAEGSLTEAARQIMPEGSPRASPEGSLDLSAARLPQDVRRRWGAFSMVAARCGGCGTEPTEADVRFFAETWLEDPQYRRRLLDAGLTHGGMAVSADGNGQKTGLAVLAGP